MSTYSFENAVIGLAREYRKYRNRPWCKDIFKSFFDDIKQGLKGDNYFDRKAVDTFIDSLESMINTFKEKTTTDEEKERRRKRAKERKEEKAKAKAEEEAKELKELERLQDKWSKPVPGTKVWRG